MSASSNANTAPSRVRERLASRNGARHSVYWVQPMSEKGRQSAASTRSTISSAASVARPVEYAISGKYTGEWKEGLQHGYGVYVYGNGNKYEGEWKEGRRDGQGTFWTPTSDNDAHIRKQYAGEWQHDQRHGHGTFYYSDGGTYEGEWQHNQRQGHGRRTFGRDHAVYDGEWHENKRSGFGILVLPNGDRYEGHWLEDKKEGPGRFYYAATHKVYEGEWVGDAPRCGTFSDVDPDHPDATFILPELGLAHPSHVVNASVADIRQGRFQESDMVDQVPESSELTALDSDLVQRLTQAFQAMETTDGTLPCRHLPSLLQTLGVAFSDDHLEALMNELGATPDTAIALPDCIDILALLSETTALEAPQEDDEDDNDDN